MARMKVDGYLRVFTNRSNRPGKAVPVPLLNAALTTSFFSEMRDPSIVI